MDSETVVMTVRHGQTDFNMQRRYAGSIDVPLNEKGAQDALDAAHSLHEAIDVTVSSPLRRALDTARLLVGPAGRIVPCDLCVERDYGAMQGLTSDEVEDVRPVIRYFKIAGDFHSLNPPGGETFPALRKRAEEFMQYLWSEHRGRRVLVASHEVFLLQLHGFLRGETWREAMAHRLPNLTLTTFRFEGERLIDENMRPLTETAQEDSRIFSHIAEERD
ncbi:MAG: histidine phosphatase family protein [Coriobacteriia bacterium]|nr:histidine phosphatase family protein [Coriobacteriia bacterium]